MQWYLLLKMLLFLCFCEQSRDGFTQVTIVGQGLNPLFLVKILTSMRCYLQDKQEDNYCVCFAAVPWHQSYSLPVQWIDFGSTLQDLALYEICHPEFPCGKITIEVRTEFVIYEKKKEQGYISQSEPSKLRARTCFTWEYIRTEVNLRWV